MKFYQLNIILITLIFLTGCRSNISISEADSGYIPPVTISISFWEPGTNKEMEIALNKIVEEYNKVQPNVTIELLSQSVIGYQDWIRAKFAANEAPDIEENHTNYLATQFRSKQLIDIENDFLSPNYYNDDIIWKDMFVEGRLESAHMYTCSPSYAVPYTGLGIAYYYNKNIYDKLSLTEPKTWDEFMENCEIIASDGCQPISMMLLKRDAVTWLYWYIFTGLYNNRYLADERFNPNMDNVIAENELARAIKLGYFDITSGEDRENYEHVLSMLKQYSSYAYNSQELDEGAAKALFLSGKAAHIMSGNWDLKSFTDNKVFKTGTFALPRFTKENSDYAGENFSMTASQVFGITNSVENSTEKREAAVDFLKFFTSPEYYKIFINGTYSIPVIKGVDIPLSFSSFGDGFCEPLQIFAKGAGSAVYDYASNANEIFTGKPFDIEDALYKLHATNLLFSEDVMKIQDVDEKNDFGVADILRQGDFTPTEPYGGLE